ncbi:pre-mRNA-splicing factor CWC25 homolog [Culicoides brevitarsis]|uniref:pre-mRNA-splicing factor CWC25 homolog n=1 Tax=Culicoides brevitarsis TaxID=469753 RepID=UPI00307B43FC
MGGGDLNTKKSWHPKNFSNQERVWKAEQKEAAEKKRLAELQREIQDERDREDLKNIARSSGFLDDGDSANKKLEWMYKGQQLNREEYLMGRTIDKNFEQLDQEEKAKADPINNVAISQPINHVEHEVIPFSIRKYKGLPGTEQVDMARKMLEDPLMLIKQKEMETRRQILQNPVKLKELHKMLKQEQSESKKKKSKKEKKSKKKRKRSDDSDSDVDLDKALAEKYKRLQGALTKDVDSDDNDDGNVDKLLSRKFEVLSKELDKMTGSKKKKKKKKNKRDSSSGSSSDDFQVSKKLENERRDDRNRRDERNFDKKRSFSRSPRRNFDRRDDRRPNFDRNRSKSPQRRDNRQFQINRRRSRSPQRHRSPDRSLRNDRKNTSPRRNRRSRSRSIEKPRQRRSRTPEKRNKSPPERREERKSSSSSSSASNSEPDNGDSDDGRPKKRNFGLVTSDGKGIALKNPQKMTKRRSPSPKKLVKSISASKSDQKRSTTKLTQEEIDARLKEMAANASWREKERTEKVQKYRDNEKREEEEAKREFDKDFLTKQLKKTANSTTSVESRIKSNLNNIQRSSRTMESNFARR